MAGIVNQYGRPISASDYESSGVKKPFDKDEQRDVEKVLRIWQSYGQAYQSIFNIQRLCTDVLNDRHWTQAEKDYAERQNRTLLTINVTRPYSMQVAGMQRMARTDMRVTPYDAVNDPKLAEIAQKTLEGVEYNSRTDIKDALIFQDGMSGIGNWEIVIDTPPVSMEPFGEVKVRRSAPCSWMYDIESYDPLLDDCNAIVGMYYMLPEQIKEKYGKGSDLKFDEREYEYWSEDLTSNPIDGFNRHINAPFRINGKYLVLELYERRRRIERKIIDKKQGVVVGVYPFEAGSTQRFVQDFPEFEVVECGQPVIKTTCVMPYYYTRLAVAEEDYSYYPVIPFASIRNGERLQESSSYNNSMLGLQTELNVRHSNQQEYVTRSIRGGYWVFSNGDDGKALMDRLDEFGHRIGQSYLVEGIPGSEPKPITPTGILAGEAFLEDGSLKYFERVTGLSAVAISGGNDQPGESGKHRQQRREESQTTLYQIIDDFNHQKALASSATLERAIAIMNPLQAVRQIGQDGNPTYIYLVADMIKNLQQVSKWDLRVMNGPFVTSRREMDNEKMIELTDLTGKFAPEQVKGLLPRIWRNSGIEGAEEIAAELEQGMLVQTEVEATMPPEAQNTPSSSGKLQAVA